ncbi:MAG: hypothetical protein AB8B50_14960 [Pirellulaceae bacterium]
MDLAGGYEVKDGLDKMLEAKRADAVSGSVRDGSDEMCSATKLAAAEN